MSHGNIESSSTSFKKYNFFKAIESELNSEDWCQNLQGLSLIESWDCLTDKLTRLMKDNIPESKTPFDPTKRRPYVNSTCMNSIKVKQRKWTRYRHSMTDANYEAY